jgi:thymidylate kinase
MTSPQPMNPFFVLIGGDGAGKTTVLRELSGRAEIEVVTLESLAASSRYDFVATARQVLFGKVLAGDYTAELKLSCLHLAVMCLHDAVSRARLERPVLVDGYYYKLLAKAACLGFADRPLVETWRALPRPARVVHLAIDPERAFERIGQAEKLNPLEHEGGAPSRERFVYFQKRMIACMLDEVSDLELVEVSAMVPAREIAVGVARAIGLEPARPGGLA